MLYLNNKNEGDRCCFFWLFFFSLSRCCAVCVQCIILPVESWEPPIKSQPEREKGRKKSSVGCSDSSCAALLYQSRRGETRKEETAGRTCRVTNSEKRCCFSSLGSPQANCGESLKERSGVGTGGHRGAQHTDVPEMDELTTQCFIEMQKNFVVFLLVCRSGASSDVVFWISWTLGHMNNLQQCKACPHQSEAPQGQNFEGYVALKNFPLLWLQSRIVRNKKVC